MSKIKTGTTLTTAYQVEGDTTGALVIQTGSTPTTAVTVAADQNVTVAGNVTLNNGTADGAQLTLSSSGYSDWNWDNYSGRLRAYYGSTEYFTINASGNVGIGTSSPARKLDVVGGSIGVASTSAGGYITNVFENSSSSGYVQLQYNVGAAGANGQASISYAPSLFFAIGPTANDTTTPIVFRNSNGTERARINPNGDFLVGATSGVGAAVPGMQYSPNGALYLGRSGTGTVAAIYFINGNGVVGQINTSGSTTAYVTSSDYRLKENVQPMTGALSKVAALKPCTYTWKVDGSDGQGFIAHELAEVAPQAVVGEKDAVDTDGNPVYQGIDTSFLVATLTAAIQEQQTISNAQQAALETLTARIEALEAK